MLDISFLVFESSTMLDIIKYNIVKWGHHAMIKHVIGVCRLVSCTGTRLTACTGTGNRFSVRFFDK